jgi:hypothetical protein
MEPQILNVDILDDKKPVVLVQRYIYPDISFQVFRKPTRPDEVFSVSPGVIIDRDLFWRVSVTLSQTADELDDDMLEIFALVYFDEDNPPVYDSAVPSEANEQLAITYDPLTARYMCEECYVSYEGIDQISAATLDEAIALGVDKLHSLITQQGDSISADEAT